MNHFHVSYSLLKQESTHVGNSIDVQTVDTRQF